MKLTLLELVQDMLVATDSENVTDVGDTEDAGMCVNIANREFERLISKFRWRHSNISEVGNIKVFTDRNPQYFTSFNDEVLIFDAFPNASGLVAEDTDCIVYNAPTSRLTTNNEYFDLPPQAFPALSLRCISKAVMEIKGDTQGAQAEKRDADNAVAALSRNARLVDILDDRRDNIIARRSMRNTFNRTIRIIV